MKKTYDLGLVKFYINGKRIEAINASMSIDNPDEDYSAGTKLNKDANSEKLEGKIGGVFYYADDYPTDLNYQGAKIDPDSASNTPPSNTSVNEIKKIEVKEGEVLVLKVDPNTSQEEIKNLIVMLQGVFPNHHNKIVILPKGTELETVKFKDKEEKHPLY